MKENTCCFSGHRRISKQMVDWINSRLFSEIISAVNEGYDTFCVGGALGFDTLAAKQILDIKQAFPYIKLRLILPCKTQYADWSKAQTSQYIEILERADSVEYISDEYTSGCMHERNRKLVDESSLCICYLTSDAGGTAYTVNYAKKAGIEVRNIADCLL